MEGGLRTAENDVKTVDKQDNGNNGASSRRLVFVGRLHTSAVSPLMKRGYSKFGLLFRCVFNVFHEGVFQILAFCSIVGTN